MQLKEAIVLDATAIYSGIEHYCSMNCKFLTTPEVVGEVSHKKEWRISINGLITSKKLEIVKPKGEWIKKVKEVAKESGDLSKISDTDLSVLALAYGLSQTIKVKLISDDYSIQNVASFLKISVIPIMDKGIKRVIKWIRYCPACSKTFHGKERVCDICGTRLKRKVQKAY
jgi:UPF0271 protein